MGDMDSSSSLTKGISRRASNLVSLADLAYSVVEPEKETYWSLDVYTLLIRVLLQVKLAGYNY